MSEHHPVLNCIVISDLHCGSRVGIFPPQMVLDRGMIVHQSKFQAGLWEDWRFMWDKWVPRVTRGEPFAVVVNGDAIEGRHHKSTEQMSQDLHDQNRIAKEVLSPVVDLCHGVFYMIRGTEVHVGKAAEEERGLADDLEAVPDEDGERCRYEMWMQLGGGLIHFAHHIGTTGRAAYETSAVMAELVEMFVETSKQRDTPPDVIVRSHRHRHIEVKVPTANVYGIAFTTPGWQGKTPHTYRIPGGRINYPQFGGALIRQGDEELYTRHITFWLGRGKVESPIVEVPYGRV